MLELPLVPAVVAFVGVGARRENWFLAWNGSAGQLPVLAFKD
jgi:hypothetical protein